LLKYEVIKMTKAEEIKNLLPKHEALMDQELVAMILGKQGHAVAEQASKLINLIGEKTVRRVTADDIDSLRLNSNAIKAIYNTVKRTDDKTAQELKSVIEKWAKDTKFSL